MTKVGFVWVLFHRVRIACLAASCETDVFALCWWDYGDGARYSKCGDNNKIIVSRGIIERLVVSGTNRGKGSGSDGFYAGRRWRC